MMKNLSFFHLALFFSLSVLISAQSIHFTSPTNGQIITETGYGSTESSVPMNLTYYFQNSNDPNLIGYYIKLFPSPYPNQQSNQGDGIDQWWYIPSGTYTWRIELWETYLGQGSFKKAEQTITFYVKYPIKSLNNFGGGIINVDGQQKDHGFVKNKLTNEVLQVGAIDQNFDGYFRVWNQSGTNNSIWQRKGKSDADFTTIWGASSRNYNYSVASNDNGAEIRGVLKKRFNISRDDALEFGTYSAGIVGTVVELNSTSITAPSTQTLNSKTGTFSYWTDGVTTRTRTISNLTNNETFTAFYKLNNNSSTLSGYNKDGQRKYIRGTDGLWKVYESSGQIWLEKDGIVVNNNLPVNDVSEGPEAKSPAMDYVIDANPSYTSIFVVYQQKLTNGKYKLKLAKFNNSGQKVYSSDILTSTYNYSTFDATPVISATRRDFAASGKAKFVVVWRQKSEGSYQNGLYYYPGVDNSTSVGWYYLPPQKLTYTDLQSSNPTITAFKQYSGALTLLHHIAYQQGTTKIKYQKLADDWNGSASGGVEQLGNLEEPSSGDGWYYNMEPSIAVVNTGTGSNYGYYTYDSPKLVWKVDYAVTHRARSNSSPDGSWQTFYNYYAGDDIGCANINASTDVTDYVIVWSELEGYYNRYIKSNNLGSQILTGTHGQDLQVANFYELWEGVDINVFHNYTWNSAPFSFQVYSFYESTNKINNMISREGRFGTLIKNEAEFYFGLGDVNSNNNLINFVSLADSEAITNTDQVNSFLITEPFEVSNNTPLSYTLFYGVKDSAIAVQNLSNGEAITFKVELIDALTNVVIGVFDEIAQSNSSLISYENISYQVNTNDIGNRSVKLKLSITENLNSETYSLSKIFSDNSPLAKSKINEVSWQGNLAIKDYALEQNYPNPFNPNTTIRYQLPKDGAVTLKIYDILGNEIATLVNENKGKGKYEINFDASSLSSGVYLYKLQIGDFINT